MEAMASNADDDQELQRALALSLQELNAANAKRLKPDAGGSTSGPLPSSGVAEERIERIAQQKPRRGRKQPQYVPSEAEAIGCFQECLSPGRQRLPVEDVVRVSF